MQKNWNVQFNSNNKIVKESIWIAVKLTISESCSGGRRVEREKSNLFKKFKTTRAQCPRSQKREQQQKWLRTSHSCTTSWLLVVTQKSKLERS